MFKKNSLWLLPFFVAVATYCYNEKVRIARRTAITLYVLNAMDVTLNNKGWYI